jgi:PAS domain S-box-containing protein
MAKHRDRKTELDEENRRLRAEQAELLRAMAVLRENAEKYARLIETTDTGYVILDTAGRVTDANQEYVRLTGRQHVNEILGKSVVEWTAEYDRERNAAEVQRCLATGAVRGLEIDYVQPDGQIVPLEVNATVLRTADKTAILTICRGIAERRQAEDALRQRTQQIQVGLEAAHMGLWLADLGSNTVATLRGEGPISGLPEGQRPATFAAFMALVHPDDRGLVKDRLGDALRRKEKYAVEFRIRRPDGAVRWVAAYGQPICGDTGEPRALLGADMDITERKRAEEGLRESEQQYRTTLESMADPIHLIDEQLRIILMNRAFLRWCGELGLGDNIIGRNVFDVFPFLSNAVREEYRLVFQTGETLISEETVEVGDKEYVTETRKIPILDHGRTVRVVTVVRDITAQRRLETERHQSEKLRALGQLAGGIAHDFNNQLAAIMGYGELLSHQLHDEELRMYAAMIVRTAARSGDLTRQLLAFARKGKYQSVPVDLHGLINEVAAMLSRTLHKRIAVKQVLTAQPSTTAGDPAQLQSALLNLAINARDAMPNGGELTFATDVVTLGEAERGAGPLPPEPGRYVRLRVTDTGVGMNEETRKRLFEPFFTTKGPGKGTGMGLAAVYGTVVNHRGMVSVASEPGRGSTFTLYLPVCDAEAVPGALLSGGTRAAEPGHILLVDDEPAVREMAAAALRRMGYRVTTCGDGAEALAFYRQSWRDVGAVILDLVMPRLNGCDTFMAMREINPGIRAILSSGHALDNEAHSLVDDGTVEFIEKPFHLDELARKVATALPQDPDSEHG